MFSSLPNSALAGGYEAEAAGQLIKMVGLPNQSQPGPGPTSRWDTLYVCLSVPSPAKLLLLIGRYPPVVLVQPRPVEELIELVP